VAQGDVETLAFAEADGDVSAGAQISGARWGRPDDRVGVAVGAAFASASHRAYLAAGGVGLRLGDGALRYAPELQSEVYYSWAVAKPLALSADLQGIAGPGFNRDRGPVALLSLRVHLEL
jgi:high affinity Mn2+ porin